MERISESLKGFQVVPAPQKRDQKEQSKEIRKAARSKQRKHKKAKGKPKKAKKAKKAPAVSLNVTCANMQTHSPQ